MKSIAIVGAGPSGLVTAKTFLHSFPRGSITLTVFESSDRVGGLWPSLPNDRNGLVNPEMPTNLSRFTVSFSDFSWKSVRFPEGTFLNPAVGSPESHNIPLFPKAWHVGKYLEAYAARFIPEGVIQLRSRITMAERVEGNGDKGWRLAWTVSDTSPPSANSAPVRAASETLEHGLFDYLIVASGFFSKPRPFDGLISNSSNSAISVKTIHSSQFRSVDDLLSDRLHDSGNLVIVGGGISGAEVAASAALQISSANCVPGRTGPAKEQKIYHVLSRPIYVLPEVLPQNPVDPKTGCINPAPHFAPLDFCLYDLGRRPEGLDLPLNGLITPERASKAHKYLRSVIGGDQSNFAPSELVHDHTEVLEPAHVALTDTYSEFVRSGHIIPVRGRATELVEDASPDNAVSLKVIPNGASKGAEEDGLTIGNVLGVVHATGFTPRPSIEWLAPSVRKRLDYDESSDRLPFLLQRYSIWNETVPNIAFVGFYEGPFWGVMEMQARMLVKYWEQKVRSDQHSVNAIDPHGAQIQLEADIREMRELRKAMLQHETRVPQFWMGDYVGLIEAMAKELGIKRADDGWGDRLGPVLGARYLDEASDRKGASLIEDEARELRGACLQSATLVARAAFRAMQGRWIMSRKLQSFVSGFPSGFFEGTATFHPRMPTDQNYDAEYLYIEAGELKTDSGHFLRASKRYVYRYKQSADKISAWFVKEDGSTVDYFFNEMNFRGPEADEQGCGWLAEGQHLCGQDWYKSQCEFRFHGVSLETFRIDYVVKGSKKDQVLETRYKR